jgi:methoxymalonate biosynthesis acyl carrier protein
LTDNRARIQAFVARHIGVHELATDEDIFAAGFVSSMFALQMVLFVEREFHITVANEDLLLDNFRTVDAVDRLVQRKATRAEGERMEPCKPS